MNPKEYTLAVARLIDQQFGGDACTALHRRFVEHLPDVLSVSQIRQVSQQVIFANKLPPLAERLILIDALDESLSARDWARILARCAAASTTAQKRVAKDRESGASIIVTGISSEEMTQVFLAWLLSIGHIGGTLRIDDTDEVDEAEQEDDLDEPRTVKELMALAEHDRAGDMEKFAALLHQRITQIWGSHMTDPDKLLLLANYLEGLSVQERQTFLSSVVNRFAKNPAESLTDFEHFLDEQIADGQFLSNLPQGLYLEVFCYRISFFRLITRFTARTISFARIPYLVKSSSGSPLSPKESCIPIDSIGTGICRLKLSATAPAKPP